MNHLHFGRHHYRIQAITLSLIVGVIGYSLLHLSSAATTYNHNAIGVINYCTLDGAGKTVIFGWAYDADTGANAFPKVQVTVGADTTVDYTDILNYNEGKVNTYLRANRPNTPITGEYGFSATMGTYYKGSSIYVSGIALNEGTGSNTNMQVDNAISNIDDIHGGYTLTAANTLPDGCLGLTPVPATPPCPAGYSGTYPNCVPPPTNPPPSNPNVTVCDLSTKQVVTIPQSTVNANPNRYSSDLSKCNTTPVTPPPTGGGGGITTPKPAPVPATAAQKAAASSSQKTGTANATAETGTLSAILSVPADGAQRVYVLFGTTANDLSSTSDDVTFDGDKTNVALSDLSPKTDYFYQIVRTSANGQVTSSPNGTFTTTGYAITLHFIDNDDKSIAGIDGVIDDPDVSQTKSDKNGDLKFYDLDGGTYSVKYLYKKLSYSKDFDTSSISEDDLSSGKTIVLQDTVNVSTLKNGSKAPLPKKHSSVGRVILLLFFILLIGGAIVWILLRRRRMLEQFNSADDYTTFSPPAGPAVVVGSDPDVIGAPAEPTPKSKTPKLVTPPVTPTTGTDSNLEHVGESLKDMVLKSMHEEAQKRKDNK
jgi:hypothetical protein